MYSIYCMNICFGMFGIGANITQPSMSDLRSNRHKRVSRTSTDNFFFSSLGDFRHESRSSSHEWEKKSLSRYSIVDCRRSSIFWLIMKYSPNETSMIGISFFANRVSLSITDVDLSIFDHDFYWNSNVYELINFGRKTFFSIEKLREEGTTL